MIKTQATLGIAPLVAMPLTTMATPQRDLAECQDYYKKRFPSTPYDDFVNGERVSDVPTFRRRSK